MERFAAAAECGHAVHQLNTGVYFCDLNAIEAEIKYLQRTRSAYTERPTSGQTSQEDILFRIDECLAKFHSFADSIKRDTTLLTYDVRKWFEVSSELQDAVEEV